MQDQQNTPHEKDHDVVIQVQALMTRFGTNIIHEGRQKRCIQENHQQLHSGVFDFPLNPLTKPIE